MLPALMAGFALVDLFALTMLARRILAARPPRWTDALGWITGAAILHFGALAALAKTWPGVSAGAAGLSMAGIIFGEIAQRALRHETERLSDRHSRTPAENGHAKTPAGSADEPSPTPVRRPGDDNETTTP